MSGRALTRVAVEVNAALEAKRQDKTIGTSLGASIVVRAGGETAQLLASVRDELAMLFIVSRATLDPTGAADGPVDVVVERAQGDKCPRCWRIVPSTDAATGLCERCTAALRSQTDAVAHR